MKFESGKVYTRRSATNPTEPDRGIIPRFVLSAGDMVSYILVYDDGRVFEQSFPSSCLHQSFRTWAQLELPVTPEIQKQVDLYHSGDRQFKDKINDLMKKTALEAASDEELLVELERRKHA